MFPTLSHLNVVPDAPSMFLPKLGVHRTSYNKDGSLNKLMFAPLSKMMVNGRDDPLPLLLPPLLPAEGPRLPIRWRKDGKLLGSGSKYRGLKNRVQSLSGVASAPNTIASDQHPSMML